LKRLLMVPAAQSRVALAVQGGARCRRLEYIRRSSHSAALGQQACIMFTMADIAASLFWFRSALDDPLLRFRNLPDKLAQRRAQMFRVTRMGSHSRAEYCLVNELVRVRAVRERSLRPKQKRIYVGR